MIQINNLFKSFDGKEVIKNLTLTFPDSGIIALCGASGYGKSTLLSLIAGLQKTIPAILNSVINVLFRCPFKSRG